MKQSRQIITIISPAANRSYGKTEERWLDWLLICIVVQFVQRKTMWTHLRMVQEKVFSLSPKVPQTSASGGTRMPKLKVHAKAIMRKMLVCE